MTTGIRWELFATVACIAALGVLVTLGWLNNEYAAIAIGALTGSGIRSIAGAATTPKPPA